MNAMTDPAARRPAPQPEAPDLREKGGPKDGQPQFLDRRLFMQLTVFTHCLGARDLAGTLEKAGVPCVLYVDVNDPRGVAVLAMSEDPAFLATDLRRVFNSHPFAELAPRTELSMLGRTYSLGYEQDLEDWLIKRPQRTVLDPESSWAVWYPLRRSGAFNALPAQEQRPILSEHGEIGRAFGNAGLAHDIRLACHGLDQKDNEFVIGLIGRELYPLSALVQAMRKTTQTSRYIDSMGPFFVGRAVWRSRP